MSRSKICGIITPLVTPFTPELTLDVSSLNKIINFVIEGGVNGIFMLGTTAECSSLTAEMKVDIVSVAVKSAAGRVPVFVNVTSPSYLETLQLSEMAASKGADYIVTAPPYYFEMNQKELYNYIELISSKSDLPLVLYNVPQYTKASFEPETVVRLSAHPKIVGIKDSSGSIMYLHKLLDKLTVTDFAILIGHESYLGESLLLGLSGGVNGGGNIFPKLYTSLYNAALHEDLNEMRKLQKMIRKVNNTVYEIVDSSMSAIIGLKYVLSIRGLCSPHMAMPVYENLKKDQMTCLKKLVKEFESCGF